MMRPAAFALLFALGLSSAAQAQSRPTYDLDSDGKITKAEFRTVQINETFKLDRNKDGQVTRAETKTLEAMARTFGGKKAEARIASLWALTDTNTDSAITKAEAGAAADKRFPTYDLNKDGWMNDAELQAMRNRSPGARS